jgi:hypothetical protein
VTYLFVKGVHRGGMHMHHDRLRQFHYQSIHKAMEVGIPAYLLDAEGSVVRVTPDGMKDRIIIAGGQPIVQPIGRMQPQQACLG